ncbi:putative calcium-binding protein CML18 [Canna indica]|uniref:Calcium-binding protein CML18 n=1 Tax=Canna indica TaxID=4628 RepID=A0AAQ3JPS1_9LILI|nr:putative calcium-binding protein CML18 [Canna indica]
MKLIDSFLSSFKKSSSSKSKMRGKRSISRTEASFASVSSSSSSYSSDEYSAAAGPQTTPRSVLHARGGELSLYDLFSVFDCDGDGKITKRELEAVLRRLVPDDPPSTEEVASMVAEVDRDGDGCISLDEFGAVEAALAGGGGAEELREVFAVFDADGDGRITAEELRGVFAMLGDVGCTIEDCRRMIGGVDTNGDGFVCFEDFMRMMMDGGDRSL